MHRKYIYDNPVERGLVVLAMECRYCSAYPEFRLDELPLAAEAAIT
jgi:hypothetical protein